MKAAKRIVIAICVYVGIVVAFESLIGVLQPEAGETLVIVTTDVDGSSAGRVVSRLESEGALYVAANHWPRAWYRKALANPEVEVSMDGGEPAPFRAVPITGADHDRVGAEHPLPFVFRILTGFPPRYFLRLDARPDTAM